MDGEKGEMNVTTSRGLPVEPWHSTPVKKNLFPTEETPDVSSVNVKDEIKARPTGLSPQNISQPMSFMSLQDSLMKANGLEISTIQRQRLELQHLIAELKDRDQELNTMSSAHHRQLLSWEQDRQRVLILEQRCARLEDELNSAQQQLYQLNQTQLNATRQQQNLQEKNQCLNSTIMKLSSRVGQLQVREEKLASMLKMKDKDVIKASNHICELSDHICELEKSLEELETHEIKVLRETEEHKQSCRKSRHKNTQLMAELQEKTIENNRQREEIIRLKQENQLLKNELSVVELELLSEDKSWKDELLDLSRSKQARAESELLCLRQVCENQQNDLQLLKLNLESVRETLRQHEGQRSPGSVTELHLDCRSPSPGSGRDPSLSIEFYDIEPRVQEGINSSTSRLQRLLAESREMLASLEGSSRKPVSPAQSPTSTDDVCPLQSIHGNDNHHSQSFTYSQEDSKTSKDRESQTRSPHLQPGHEDL